MSPFVFDPTDCAVLLIDVQERFLPVIPAIVPEAACGRACRQLLAGAGLLGLPVIISEQYPKGLGATLPHLLAAAPADAMRIEKMHFSCVEDPAFSRHLDHLDPAVVVVAGIEAHVCVLATVADLIAGGHQVVVCGDAVASRDASHCALALTAMRDLGALVVPVESVLLRVQRMAGVGCFKQLSALIR